MTPTQTHEPTSKAPIRLWPGVLLALLVVLVRFGLPSISPGDAILGVLGALAVGLAILVWWAFFSRAPWTERVEAIGLLLLAFFATSQFVHPSIRTGMMGMMVPMYAGPILAVALVVGIAAGHRWSRGARRLALIASLVLGVAVWTMVRTDGITGGGTAQLAWRWSPTAEDRLLARDRDERLAAPPSPAAEAPAASPASGTTSEASNAPSAVPAAPPAAAADESRLTRTDDESTPAHSPDLVKASAAAWPGFRGAARDAVVRGVRIETDWSRTPPHLLWRRPVGPGWSSVAVQGDLLYTQEQRGDDEVVAAYRLATGDPVWRHRDAVRFWESNGGAGPRATPTLASGRVYTFGATGILNALDGRTGAVVWSRNVATDSQTNVPTWGFSSSPLVVDDLVIVAAAGTLVAYDLASGRQRWVGPVRGGSYSSPHRSTIDSVEQVLLLSDAGTTSVAPASGAVLWEHAWSGGSIVQPAVTPDGDVLVNAIGMTGGMATRRLAVAHRSEGWKVEERWTSTALKPYFNDFVVHAGHAFGFDGSILACIDLADGKRKWKGGRYGNGQLVLLPDQDLLLVLTEDGDLALVAATPDQFKEIARVPAIEGKTWNHPALAGDILLVRNGQEMLAFRLSLAAR